MIEFKNVIKSYRYDFWSPKFYALNGASFQISSGKIIGFLGANGAGKTTSLKMIMDFIRPDSGEIKFDETLGADRNDILRHIGFLPERPYFYPTLTGRQFCHFMGELQNLNRRQIEKAIEKWSIAFHIDYAIDRKINSYSKGMLQRIGFVATLLHDPDLIILDEPLSGLDPIGRKEIKDALVALNREGKTIFFSSHIVSDVEEICSEVVVLEKGKVIYQGAIDSLISEHKTQNGVQPTLEEVIYQVRGCNE